MGLDRAVTYEGVTTTLSAPPIHNQYVSSWNVRESAGTPGAAIVKLRDTMPVSAAPTVAETAVAGLSTIGLHMVALTVVTKHGESQVGAITEVTYAGTLHVLVTFAVIPPTDVKVLGRRIYSTKAGAPVTTGKPTPPASRPPGTCW